MKPLTPLDRLLAALLGLSSFALYVRTLAQSLLFDDSAEFQVLASTLGVAHPTGYPVYLLIGRLFSLLPVKDPAYRVNLLSAAAAALAVALVYLLIRQLGGWHAPAILSSLTLALTPLFWRHALIAEIYTPAAAWLALIFSLLLSWRQSQNPRFLFAAGLLGGLSLGIHTTILLAAPAVLLYLAITARKRAEWAWAAAGALGGAVLFLGAFLLLDHLDAPSGYYNSVIRPSLSVWGLTAADFDSPLERLKFLYIPPQFQGAFFALPLQQAAHRLGGFFSTVIPVAALAVVGLVGLCVPRQETPSRWREALLLLLTFAALLAFAITYRVMDYQVFLIPAIVPLAAALGLGMSAVFDLLAAIPSFSRVIPVVLSLFLLVLWGVRTAPPVITTWEQRYPPFLEPWEMRLFQNANPFRSEAGQIIDRLEDNAIVFTNWGQLYNFYYVAHLEQSRTGMSFHETHPQAGARGLADSLLAYIEANLDSRPIYFTERPAELASRYRIQPAGSNLFRITRLP